MNLLCPNCQKMLTVPEEFAGQLMKCPLCAGTFTVPALPGAPAPSSPPADVYPLRQDPAPPPPSPAANFQTAPAAPPPSSTATKATPPPPAPSTSTLPPEGYQHTATVWFSPRVLPWVAPVCLLLVFLLSFFSWLGLYPGGVPAATQNAWQAAFGLDTVDGDLKALVPWVEDEKYKPGVSVLTVFYLLLFFPVLAVTIAGVVLDHLHLKLPPAVQQFLPWRWGIIAALNLVLFLFLALQLLLNFSLESRYKDFVENKTKASNKEPRETKETKMDQAREGQLLERLSRTSPLRLVVLLHLAAIVCSALMFWVAQRGSSRPLPRVELVW